MHAHSQKSPALFFWLRHPASVTADILPLLIHFDSLARQIAKLFVHVIGERFAGFTNHSRNVFLPTSNMRATARSVAPSQSANRTKACFFLEIRFRVAIFRLLSRNNDINIKIMSTRKDNIISWGGVRKGAGRKSEGKRGYSVTLTEANVEKALKRETNLSALLDRLLARWLLIA